MKNIITHEEQICLPNDNFDWKCAINATINRYVFPCQCNGNIKLYHQNIRSFKKNCNFYFYIENTLLNYFNRVNYIDYPLAKKESYVLQEYKFNAEDWNCPPLLKKSIYGCEKFSCIFLHPDKNKKYSYIHLNKNIERKSNEEKDEENYEETDEETDEEKYEKNYEEKDDKSSYTNVKLFAYKSDNCF